MMNGGGGKVYYNKKLFPYALPTIYLALIIVLFNRLRRKQYRKMLNALRAIISLGFVPIKKAN
jgi:hypothetical protein